MFRSKSRAIIVPQSEHLHLAGELARLWGNADFDLPPFDRESIVAGIGGHDRGYGYIDNWPIGGMDEETWNDIARRGFAMQCSDPVADLIAKYHVRRLAGYSDLPSRKAMDAEFSAKIAETLVAHGLSQDVFDRIDRITNLCDMISFAFCFEEESTGTVEIFPRNCGENQPIKVEYKVSGSRIDCSPWPFTVEEYSGYITAFRAEGYPATLDPVILPYQLSSTQQLLSRQI